MSPAMPNTAPRYAERTGTAVRPRPGSSAIRRPLVAVGSQTLPGGDLDDRRRASTRARFEFERRAPGAAAGGDDRDRDDDHDDGDDAQSQDGPVEVHARVGFGAARDTDREQRRRGDGPDRGEERAAASAINSAGYAVDRGALAAGESERAQRRLVDAREGDLPGQHDRDRDPTGESSDSGEDPQRRR